MAIIPSDEKVFMVSNSTNTTYSGSAALKAMQQWYTMEDVTNTVRPYQVYTALLTQSGGDDIRQLVWGDELTIGVTYEVFDTKAGDDFRNVGGPLIINNNDFNGVRFMATGTTPTNWSGGTGVEYNLGAPVATVLENTIGNVWFTFQSDGRYSAISNELFIENKTAKFGGWVDSDIDAYFRFGSDGDSINEITLATGDPGPMNSYLKNATIEIRVYN